MLGSLIGAEAADRVEALIRDAVAKGAILRAGGQRDGITMDAMMLDDVTPLMRICTEESCGPVACVLRAVDTGDAIRLANDTEYGLAEAVLGRNIGRRIRPEGA